MSSNMLQRNGGAMLVALCAVTFFSACVTQEEQKAIAERRCPTPQDSIVGGAVVAFAKTASPVAHRYLYAARTDSALPESASWGLQGRTTFHTWLPDTANMRKMRAYLNEQKGYVNLLIAYHGQKKLPDGRLAMEFSGTYIAGKNDGEKVPRKSVIFSCAAPTDRFIVGEPLPPAAPATP